MRSLYIILVILCCTQVACAQHNYKQYHLGINRAEEQAFVEQDIKAALATFQQTFSQYDFVFVHDCMTAIQLALYDSNRTAFLELADKAAKNGLLPRHMNAIGYIRKHPIYQQYSDSIVRICLRNRPGYLARIDTTALNKMYSLYAYDQMEKNPMKGENRGEIQRRYKPQIAKTMAELKKLIEERGWPSDKLIGIAQKDIMKELKTGKFDMMDFYNKYKDGYNYSIGIGQFTIEEYGLYSTFFFPIMAHYGGYFGFNFYPDEFYIKQIELGYLHPKDIAYVLDFWVDANHDMETTRTRRLNNRYFGTCMTGRPQTATAESYTAPLSKINRDRSKFYIKPVETEIAKDQFMHRHHMYFAWGYNGCRL